MLDGQGYGQMSDVLGGIDWVIHHAREYNIRVMNISLAADSTESYLTDPLARAARAAVAAGITVVAAAGNFGRTVDGKTRYGGIGSPGNDPSVITVGAVNMHDTPDRADDTVNNFSSRGPTRSSWVDSGGVRRYDNLVKPDLVAAGNKVVSVMAADNGSMKHLAWLPKNYPELTHVPSATQKRGETLMILSGTSVAAPVVAGAAAVLLQANPGLTPPLIKAILQYSAEPLTGATLLDQGAGLVNVAGAVSLAQALRTDIASAIEAGTIASGDHLLAPGKSLPHARTTLEGRTFGWSRVVVGRWQLPAQRPRPLHPLPEHVRPAHRLGPQHRMAQRGRVLASVGRHSRGDVPENDPRLSDRQPSPAHAWRDLCRLSCRPQLVLWTDGPVHSDQPAVRLARERQRHRPD